MSNQTLIQDIQTRKDNFDNKLGLANPATEQANRIAAFFKGCPGITTSFVYPADEGTPTIAIFVTDPEQADYLNRVIVRQYDFGGITLDVQVVQAVPGDVVVLNPPSDTLSLSKYEIFKKAMKDNPNIVDFFEIYVPIFNTWYRFCETAPKVLYYQADDLSNLHGYKAVLAEELVKEIFAFNVQDGIGCFVSTHVPEFKK